MNPDLLPIIIIILSSIAAVLMHRMIEGNNKSSNGFSGWKYGISLILLLAGVVLVVVESKNVTQATATKRWPTVSGKIKSINILQSGGVRPEIKYTYQVGHQQFAGESDYHYPYLGMSSTRKEVANKIVSGFELHKPVVVYYNPDNPADSLLKTGAEWHEFTRLSLGTILYGAGIFILYSGWLNRANAGSSKRS